MKLRYSPTSPYVRKVNILAIEAGLDDRIERIMTNTADPASDLPDMNPLGKVPTLITDQGRALYDSAVICEYLDSLHRGLKLFPASGEERWRALRLQALGDGILDAAVLCMLETKRRPEALRWDVWITRQRDKITRSLDLLEKESMQLEGQFTIGLITIVAALDYLDFRLPDMAWRDGRPAVTAWYDKVCERPSVQTTRPKEA